MNSNNILDLEKNANSLKAWPFIEALKIKNQLGSVVPDKGYVLFATGYGPSGLPHIGTFAEVARTTMVQRAFEYITDYKIPTKILCVSDDLDGLRKVPTNVPNQEMLHNYLDVPLTSIPDPFGENESYGHHMNSKLRGFLDRFDFDYEFLSATEAYKNGIFNTGLLKVLEKYQDIMDIMLPTLGPDRQKTYSPFLPLCSRTGKLLQVRTENINLEKGTITYKDPETTELIEISVINGNCKLQWKPDFGMRWAILQVDYEMYGKDHMPNSAIYSKICSTIGGKPPVQFFYELFLNETGQKISKSKGNSLEVETWLKYSPLESLALYMYHAPSKAKRLYFDIIPKNVDEYITFVKKYHAEEFIAKINNPVWHIHSILDKVVDHNGPSVPQINMHNLTFTLLLNLAAVCDPQEPSVLWGFIKKYAPDFNPEKDLFLVKLIEYTIRYYHDFIKPNKNYLVPNQEQIAMLQIIYDGLENMEHNENNITAEEIQNMLYAIARQSSKDLYQYFSELYQILLGQQEGPRLGSFIKLFGISKTRKLIKVFLKS